jgi:hypothetical protein
MALVKDLAKAVIDESSILQLKLEAIQLQYQAQGSRP